jgi:hypothetical protein
LNQTNNFIEHIKKLEDENARITEENASLKNKLKDKTCHACLFKTKNRKGKLFFGIKTAHRARKEHEVRDFIDETSKMLNKIGLTIYDIKIAEQKTDCDDMGFSLTQDYLKCFKQPVSKVSFFKDILFISDRAYDLFEKELSVNQSLPKIHFVKKYRKEINKKILLKKVGCGVFVNSIEKRIELQLKYFLGKSTSAEFPNIVDDTLTVMLAADGTQVGKVSSKIKVCFVVINELVENSYNKKKSRLGGYHTLGIIEGKESYNNLKEPFKYVNDGLKNLENKGFLHNNKKYKIKIVLGADMSLSAKAQGVKPANSHHPCVMCTCEQKEFYDPDMHATKQGETAENYTYDNQKMQWRETSEHTIIPFPNYCRTGELCKKVVEKEFIVEDGSKPIGDLGFCYASLLPDFEYDIYVPDTLHLLIRMVNIILQRFAVRIMYFDKYDGKTKIDFEIHLRIAKLFEFFESCKIKVTIVEASTLTCFKPLDGDQCMKLLRNVKAGKLDTHYNRNNLDEVVHDWIEGTFCKLFNSEVNPELNIDTGELKLTEMLWEEFNDIYEAIISNEITVYNLKLATAQWINIYTCLYPPETVTLYMHIFYGHLHSIFSKYGSIHLFNLQSNFNIL